MIGTTRKRQSLFRRIRAFSALLLLYLPACSSAQHPAAPAYSSPSSPTNAATRPDPQVQRAQALAEQGQTQRALTLLEEITRRNPKRVEGWRLMADIARDTGQMDREIPALRQLIRLSPEDASALTRLGTLYLQLEWYNQAEPLFRRAVEIAPESAEAVIGQVGYWYITGQPGKAVALLEKSLPRHPDNDQLYHALSENYRALGRYAEAENAARQGLARNPDNTRLYKQLGQVLLSGKNRARLSEAEAALRRALEKMPDDFESVYLLATAVEGQGRLEEAEKLYRSISGVRTELNPALYRLARLCLRQGKRTEGLYLQEQYQKAKRARDAVDAQRKRLWHGDSAAAHRAMSEYYRREGDLPRAIIEAERVLELAPQDADAKRLLQALRAHTKPR